MSAGRLEVEVKGEENESAAEVEFCASEVESLAVVAFSSCSRCCCCCCCNAELGTVCPDPDRLFLIIVNYGPSRVTQ